MKQLFTFGVFISSAILGAFANDKYIGNPTWDTFMKDQHLLDVNGNSISHESLRGKYVGLYFSASWCSPCKSFTKKLVDFRNKNSDKFEFVLLSLDKNPTRRAEYIRTSKLSYVHGKSAHELFPMLKSYTKRGTIPSVILFSPTRKFLTDSAQSYIVKYPSDIGKWFGR